MIRVRLVATSFFLGGFILFVTALPAQTPPQEQIRTLLRNRLEVFRMDAQAAENPVPILRLDQAARFYEKRDFQPLWSFDSLLLAQLVAALEEAGGEGLEPNDYHLQHLVDFQHTLQTGGPVDPRLAVDLELLATDSFLSYGSHLLRGRVHPVTFDPEWLTEPRETNLVNLLNHAVERRSVSRALGELLPQHEGYFILKKALSRYRVLQAAGGWSTIPEGPKLEVGLTDPRIASLRSRLRKTGDLQEEEIGRTTFDEELQKAVVRFQERHGLDADGVVGPRTLAALNTPVEERIDQIRLNLERWRWLPQDLGDRYVLVNIAAFQLHVVEKEREAFAMPVVVGRSYRRTPVFSDRIRYLVFSPYWHVPPSLAAKDIFPKIRQEPEYAIREGFRIFRGWGAATEALDPLQIDWSVPAATQGLRLRQEPGPRNALGQVKFMFPNSFNVYLHDTPSRELFRRSERASSSGCIRIERPMDLAEYLLRNNPGWDRSRIETAARRGSEETVTLRDPMPVHLLYWTAWADEEGIISFRNDVYGRDALLETALQSFSP